MLNVCAYCRVSTDKSDQANSLEAQKRYFYDCISKNPDWRLTEIFADSGITGTSIKKRTAFKKMIGCALSGEIDLIITKEVSRFARNTVDALTYTRLLKQHGVGVLFLSDGINTLSSDGELRLSILSTIAQEESRKTSERVKWGQLQSMKRGVVFGNGVYGYDLKNGVLTVNEEQAKTVKEIFRLRVYEGLNPRQIAERISRPEREWKTETIRKMLKNEKYCGDLVCRKQETVDYLNHTRRTNTQNRIIINNHHEAIVSRKLFLQAQTRTAHAKKRTQ